MARYKTWEVFKMLTENPKLEFGMIVGGVRINKTLSTLNTPVGKRYFLEPGEYTGFVYTDTEWELIRNPVTFMEAVKAFKEGKMIICELEGSDYKYSDSGYDRTNDEGETYFVSLIDAEDNAVSCEEILDGKWFIEEDEI